NALDDQPLPVYGDGKNRRDWLHVSDHCAALVALMEAPGIDGEIVHIASGRESDVLEITDRILRHLGKPRTLIRHVEDRPGHDRRYALVTTKLERLTGWRPTISFDQGLQDTVDWYRDHPGWWRPLKDADFRAYYARTYAQRGILKEVGE